MKIVITDQDPGRHNHIEYPMEIGAQKFEPIPVEKQKDIMINVARMHGQQEYNRIMDLVKVLQKQADELKRRLDVTDWVHSAKYDFQIYHGQCYWLVYNSNTKQTLLTHLGPKDWSSAPPIEYEYLARVKWLGDYTWIEVDEEGNDVWK